MSANDNWHSPDSFCQHIATHFHRDPGAAYTLNGELVPVQEALSPEEVDRNLGWDVREPSAKDKQFEMAGDVLGEIVRWISDSDTLQGAGTRAVSLGCLVRPELFGGSMAEAGRRFGITRAAIQKQARAIRDMGHGIFQGRVQRNQEVRDQRRTITTNQHRKAGHTINGKK